MLGLAPDTGRTLRYEVAHRKLLERFGRYPGRNAALGRESTVEELAHLEEHGSF